MTLQVRIAMERAVAASAEESAILIQIENVMSLTPAMPRPLFGAWINGQPPDDDWRASAMLVARRQQIDILLQMAAAASPQVRARFRR